MLWGAIESARRPVTAAGQCPCEKSWLRAKGGAIMSEFFGGVEKVPFEGRDSKNWLAFGADIEAGRAGLAELRTNMLIKGEISPNGSGRVEMIENILNEYIR